MKIDLTAARALAAKHVEDDDDANQLRLLIFQLCDHIEDLHKHERSPRYPLKE